MIGDGGMESEREGAGGVVFRDMTLLLLLTLLAVIVVLLTFFNPPVEAENARAPGGLRFWCEWPQEIDADVDMWVRAPQGSPIGYSNKGNEYADLIRDDLGHYRDISNNNEELIVSRGILPGEWILNLHYYRYQGPGQDAPVAVHCWAEMSNTKQEAVAVLVDRTATLERANQELTVFRFRVTDDGTLIPESVNDRFLALRSAAPAAPQEVAFRFGQGR